LVGRVLDVGCDTGEHALMAASLGYQAVGVDMSMRAIELAKTKATERGVEARFVVADALRLVDLGELAVVKNWSNEIQDGVAVGLRSNQRTSTPDPMERT